MQMQSFVLHLHQETENYVGLCCGQAAGTEEDLDLGE